MSLGSNSIPRFEFRLWDCDMTRQDHEILIHASPGEWQRDHIQAAEKKSVSWMSWCTTTEYLQLQVEVQAIAFTKKLQLLVQASGKVAWFECLRALVFQCRNLHYSGTHHCVEVYTPCGRPSTWSDTSWTVEIAIPPRNGQYNVLLSHSTMDHQHFDENFVKKFLTAGKNYRRGSQVDPGSIYIAFVLWYDMSHLLWFVQL